MRRIAALALVLGGAPALTQVSGPFGISHDDRQPAPYYPDRDYRSDMQHPPLVMHRTDRVYRGQNGRLYCRRSNGTTGLIGGGVEGAVTGAMLAKGQSRTLGALLGSAVGAVIGQQVDRGEVTCR